MTDLKRCHRCDSHRLVIDRDQIECLNCGFVLHYISMQEQWNALYDIKEMALNLRLLSDELRDIGDMYCAVRLRDKSDELYSTLPGFKKDNPNHEIPS